MAISIDAGRCPTQKRRVGEGSMATGNAYFLNALQVPAVMLQFSALRPAGGSAGARSVAFAGYKKISKLLGS